MLHRLFRYAASCASALLFACSPAQAEPPAISAFFKTPTIQEPRLSPSGRYLAVQILGSSERVVLAVLDLQAPDAPKVVASFNDADVFHHAWVNDKRLVLQLANSQDQVTRVASPGLWAVDRDGGNQRQLIYSDFQFVTKGGHVVDKRLDGNWHYVSVPADNGDEVLIARHRWQDEPETTSVQLARLNTVTGRTRSVSYGFPDSVRDWTVDWRGEPRVVIAQRQGRDYLYLRDGDGWRLWKDADPELLDSPRPRWFDPNGTVLAVDGHKGYTALFKLDPQTLEREPAPLLSAAGYDVNARFVFDHVAQRLLGVQFETDAVNSVWFDPDMKSLQAEIDGKLPGTVNRIECLRCLKATHVVVTALSDRRPPVYYVYQPETKALQTLAGLRPDLSPRQMGQRDYHRVKTRDGLDMPVLVTQPAGGTGKSKHPAVILVHGGPYVRGTHWAWSANAQFLASRGYLVIEPEFRGSRGYGGRFFKAGWKQWGLAMQDDLADALAWAVKQGWVDEKRVCIAGASYGGYAALMGAIKQADSFQCAVNWLGVTDLGLLSSISWSDASEEWKRYGMKRLVVDPEKDAEQIRATSPLQRAREIKIPLLMAYGAEDRRVPIKHGIDLKAAMSPDQPLEWVSYAEEGHGWHLLKTNEDFWGRVERFLAKHIGSPN